MTVSQMEYKFDIDTLKFIWSTLRQPESWPNLQAAQKLTKRIIKKGWAFNSDVEDLIHYHDNRTGSHKFDVMKFSNLFDIHWERVCFRPKARSKYVSEFDAIRCEDAALLLILMERIGFQTDASFFVHQVMPGIWSRKKELLNNAELEIFWYGTTKDKFAPFILKNEEDWKKMRELDSFKTASGYKITVKGIKDGEPGEIEIRSPKFRRQREPQRTTCEECGVEWYKGDPDSSSNHRKEHKKRMYYLNPKPSLKMISELQSNNEPELVTTKSPAWKHKEIYLRARAFRREFHYDFVQWQSENGDDDPYVHGFLFTNEEGAIVGACSFRKRNKESIELSWTLDWVWICPKERRNGHLATRWRTLRKQFGQFSLTHPVSDAMKTFLSKQGDLALLGSA